MSEEEEEADGAGDGDEPSPGAQHCGLIVEIRGAE